MTARCNGQRLTHRTVAVADRLNRQAPSEAAMNWEVVGAIAETIGAVAVVVTLLFVARDIRQNSKSLSMSALRDTTAQWNQWSEMIATSSDLADIVAKGNESYSRLSTSERLRYGAYVQSFFDNVESYRKLVIDHSTDKDLAVLRAITRRRSNIPGFKSWWSENTADYSQEFVAWIEDLNNDT